MELSDNGKVWVVEWRVTPTSEWRVHKACESEQHAHLVLDVMRSPRAKFDGRVVEYRRVETGERDERQD